MKKHFVIVGIAAITCAGGLAAWRATNVNRASRPAAPPPIPVVATKVQVSDVPIVMTAIGTVVPSNVVDIHTQVTGTIEEICFVEGQTVHRGSLIAQLDPRPFEAAVKQDKANLAWDLAHLTNVEANLRRYLPS